jgi:hypothetical protein
VVAISQLWQCYSTTRQQEKAKAMIDAMREALTNIAAEKFDKSDDIHDRAFWEKWLVSVAPPPPPAGQPATPPGNLPINRPDAGNGKMQ